MDPQTATPPPPQKVTLLNRINTLLSWAMRNKRMSLVGLSAIFLIAVIIWIIFQVFGKSFLPFLKKSDEASTNNAQNTNPTTGALILKTDKSVYTKDEVVKVQVFGDSKSEIIRGFDILVTFDSAFLGLTDKRSTPLSPDFHYYGTTNGTTKMRISGVQELNSKKDLVFSNTLLYEFEFQTKKSGKTSIQLVQSVNLVNESNLINRDSKDILGIAGGQEIEIR